VAVFAIVQAPSGDFLTAHVATLASSGSSISAEQIAALRQEFRLARPTRAGRNAPCYVRLPAVISRVVIEPRSSL